MPQDAWSPKRERQYEHIKDSYEDRGVSEDEAEERAARTVNKERAEKGETKAARARKSA
jgi:plasmid stabilization system protein ParE